MLGCGVGFGLKGQRLTRAVAIIAGLTFFLFGFDQGVIEGVLQNKFWAEQFPKINNDDSNAYVATIQGATIGSHQLGSWLSALLTIFIGDTFGRKHLVFSGLTIMIVGVVLQCTAFDMPQLIIGRVIAGFGNGLNISTVPTWVSEISKSHNRGTMVILGGTLFAGGLCLSSWVTFGCVFIGGPLSWRLPVAFPGIFALVLLAGINEIPESPRWLILKGPQEQERAKLIIAAIEEAEQSIGDAHVNAEYIDIKNTVMEVHSQGWLKLFTMGPERHLHRVVLGCVIQVLQQMSGITTSTYYAATIYASFGFSSKNATILAASVATIYFLVSWVALTMIEVPGRRTLMLTGSLGMSISMAVVAATNYLKQEHFEKGDYSEAAHFVATIFFIIFNAFFAGCWLGTTWLYAAEIVPLRVRAPANGLSTSANSLFNFLIMMITPNALKSISYKTYVIFAVINACIFPIVYFFYPETRYRSLNEIDRLFSRAQPGWRGWFDIVKRAKEEPNKYNGRGQLVREENELESVKSEEVRVAEEGPTQVPRDAPNVLHVEYETV